MTTQPYYADDVVTLMHGDALEQARSLPSSSVQTIVTSPPYFGLRDYGQDGQLGAEDSVADFVANMVALFAELRRVLANDGTLWLNRGDSYVADAGEGRGRNTAYRDRRAAAVRSPTIAQGVPKKNLLGIPWRVALALQADGWILRSEVIWAKPNPMPESVTDRPTKSHETIFLFAKSPIYYYDANAIAEARSEESLLDHLRRKPSDRSNGAVPDRGHGDKGLRTNGVIVSELRNKRSVWTVPTVPFSASHFAVYPPELIRPCILAGSRPGDTVLDPFSGSGTTGMVATQEGRKYIGIDLNSDYLDLSLNTRFAQPVLNFGGV